MTKVTKTTRYSNMVPHIQPRRAHASAFHDMHQAKLQELEAMQQDMQRKLDTSEALRGRDREHVQHLLDQLEDVQQKLDACEKLRERDQADLDDLKAKHGSALKDVREQLNTSEKDCDRLRADLDVCRTRHESVCDENLGLRQQNGAMIKVHGAFVKMRTQVENAVDGWLAKQTVRIRKEKAYIWLSQRDLDTVQHHFERLTMSYKDVGDHLEQLGEAYWLPPVENGPVENTTMENTLLWQAPTTQADFSPAAALLTALPGEQANWIDTSGPPLGGLGPCPAFQGDGVAAFQGGGIAASPMTDMAGLAVVPYMYPEAVVADWPAAAGLPGGSMMQMDTEMEEAMAMADGQGGASGDMGLSTAWVNIGLGSWTASDFSDGDGDGLGGSDPVDVDGAGDGLGEPDPVLCI